MPASQKSPAARIAASSRAACKPACAVPGVEYLIGQVENMVRESGAPKGFDAALWLSAWLHAPLPALGSRTPASYMDTVEGLTKTGVEHSGDGAKRSLRLSSVIWRIAVEAPAYIANDLSGAGAKFTGGRWNSTGTPMVYCSANIALATLETLSFIRTGSSPFNRYLVRIEVPASVWKMREVLAPLPAGWDAVPSGLASRKAGDGWIVSGRSPLLAVPSVIVPDEYNILINPSHPAIAQIIATTVRRRMVDPRFFQPTRPCAKEITGQADNSPPVAKQFGKMFSNWRTP